MKTFTFNSTKYGKELLMDMGRIEETPEFFLEQTPHTVDFYEIFIFRKAKGTFQLDDQIIELRDHLIVYASPYQRRSWNVERVDIFGHFLIFANNFLEHLFADSLFVFRLRFFHNHQTPLFIIEGKHSIRYHDDVLPQMLRELNNLKPDSEDFIRAFLLLILAGHNRQYCAVYGLIPERDTNNEAFLFKQLLERHIRQYKQVEDYSRILGISRITLNSQVKTKFGVTASQLIKNRLLTEIQRELLFTNKTATEIAYELHFSEPQHLNRFFKNMVGITPFVYRNQH